MHALRERMSLLHELVHLTTQEAYWCTCCLEPNSVSSAKKGLHLTIQNDFYYSCARSSRQIRFTRQIRAKYDLYARSSRQMRQGNKAFAPNTIYTPGLRAKCVKGTRPSRLSIRRPLQDACVDYLLQLSVYLHVCVCVHMHVYIRTDCKDHTYMHTYIHAYIKIDLTDYT